MQRQIYCLKLCEPVGEIVKVLGRIDRYVTIPTSLDNAIYNSISFCNGPLKPTKAGVVVCSKDLTYLESDYKDKTLLLVSNPRIAFIRIMEAYFQEIDYSIHPTAIIKPNVTIGENVTVDANTVIGSSGFGYEKNELGSFEKFPHIGGVIIKNNVEIGCNTCIDKGTLGNTIIKEGTKINNLVHIAHNVEIGRHCIIHAQCYIGGSVKVGDYSWIAPGAIIRDRVKIGNNVTVGMGAVVTKDVEDGKIVFGVPAR